MAAPSADEILELYDELNFPSAPRLRAALLKKGYRARLKDVEAFVKAQTPTQLFAKGPTYRGHITNSKVNGRFAIDYIDATAEPTAILDTSCWSKTSTTESSGPRLLPRRNQQTTLRYSSLSCAKLADRRN